MYKNYIFDLYGTLLDIRTNEEKKSLWKKMAAFYSFNGAIYKANKLRSAYTEYVQKEKELVRKHHPEFNHIDIVIDRVFKRLYEDKGVQPSKELVEVTARLFRCLSTVMPAKPYDGVKELFKELHKKGKKIYLLSNAQSSFTVPELKVTKLYEKFDGILISSEEQCCKPDKEFFEALFNRFNLKKSESIMIGNDESSDIKGANDFGIDSLYIHTEISPELKGERPDCKYFVPDGDFKKISSLIVK